MRGKEYGGIWRDRDSERALAGEEWAHRRLSGQNVANQPSLISYGSVTGKLLAAGTETKQGTFGQ